LGKSLRELRTRIKSVESTMHITRAMDLVSSSKFKKAFDTLEKGRCYFDLLKDTFADISAYVGDSPYFKGREVKKRTIVVIAGDRGLVGGYNNNIYKAVSSLESGDNDVIIPFGKKANEHYKNYDGVMQKIELAVCDKIKPEDIKALAVSLAKSFINGETDEICVVYTRYLTMLSQETVSAKLLPIDAKTDGKKASVMTFEPSAAAVLSNAVPEYISGRIYGALCEAIASENAARRTAMDSATKNAGEIIDTLTLDYNRARQSAITQEITEIIAGSES
jgi:F-type H+-transporting ATPase subunit gamma